MVYWNISFKRRKHCYPGLAWKVSDFHKFSSLRLPETISLFFGDATVPCQAHQSAQGKAHNPVEDDVEMDIPDEEETLQEGEDDSVVEGPRFFSGFPGCPGMGMKIGVSMHLLIKAISHRKTWNTHHSGCVCFPDIIIYDPQCSAAVHRQNHFRQIAGLGHVYHKHEIEGWRIWFQELV